MWESGDGLPTHLTLPEASSKRKPASVTLSEATEPTDFVRRGLSRTARVGAVGTVTLCVVPCLEHDHERHARKGSFIVKAWPKGHVVWGIARGETHTTNYTEAVRCFAANLDMMTTIATPDALKESIKRYRATREAKQMADDVRRLERRMRIQGLLEEAQQNSVGMALVKAGIRLGGLR